MMSRAPRWPESPLDTKTVKPTQKPGAKQRASSAAPVLRAGKQASNSKTGDAHGWSRSLNRNGSDASGGGLGGQQTTRQASGPGIRLCSSRSFSSLHTSALSTAPFMRSSRSLTRLDRSSTTDDGVSNLQVRTGKRIEKKACGSSQLSSSGDDTRDNQKTMSSSSESSSNLSSAEACAPNGRKIKKQTRDGVYSVCAMTSGMRRNWVQTVLKNVRPSLTNGIPSSPAVETIPLNTQQPDPHSAKDEEEEILHKPDDSAGQPKWQKSEGEQISADGSSEMPLIGLNEGEAEPCDDSTANIQTSETEALSKGQTEEPDVQMEEQVETDNQSEEQHASLNTIRDGVKASNKQLMKELEQTQKELSRLQQLNQSLQVELQRERKSHPQNDGSNQDQAQLLRLQKINRDLRSELESLKREQEEAREAELRRRVDLLAQQAQLLVTGDATALAQVQLEQDRRKFFELQAELERCVASLQSQLDSSEEQKKEAQLSLTKLQLELEHFHGARQENEGLQAQLEEATHQLRTNEEAQAQKQACLEKHLTLLQASQDRERRGLATSLEQAEQRAKDLQQRLEVAEEQVLNMNQTEAWATEIERVKAELEEELRCAVSEAQKLQEEREQLQHQCKELQNQFSAADREVSRLESCLKTSETHYYSLERSYEKVCEQLQGALKKVQKKESEKQDMREDCKRLLDRKEQELCEVLLKMEVLGNSLEETELKMNDLLRGASSASSQLKDDPSDPARQEERQTDDNDVSQDPHCATITNCSSDSTYQDFDSVGEDQKRYMSVIQVLESKLFVTEEKLRDIMQRLEEHQSDVACQDPTLCSQLTQSRASAQHLSLLLHSQAKKNQGFAQETENCCRLLVGRFQVALNIVQACRERLLLAPVDMTDFEKQLATVAACLQQGERDAERHKQESRSISKGEDKLLDDEPAAAAESGNDAETVESYLKNEIFVVEHMVSVLQSEHAGLFSFAPREDEEAATKKFISIITQRVNLKTRAEYDNNEVKGSISRACADAELIYAAVKLQWQLHHERKSLADTSPPELAPYEELDNVLEAAAKQDEEAEADVKQVEMDGETDWLKGLLSRLKSRVESLDQVAQEICDDGGMRCDTDDAGINAAAADLNWILEEVRLIYLSERLKLDWEQESKQRGMTVKDGQETLTPSLSGLGEDNSRLGEELEFPESVRQKIPKDMQEINSFHERRLRTLQKEFHERVMELQQIHNEEIKHLQAEGCEKQKEGGDEADLQEKPQASGSDDFSALEEMHMQLIQDLQQQHEQEVAALLLETDQQLQKEMVATLTAIAAMRRAHKRKLGQNFHTQDDVDVEQVYHGCDGEVQVLQRELQILSVQHSQKCLENCQLNQQLQDQGEALKQCQKQIQELKPKQRDEISEVQLANGKQPHVSPYTTDRYEMEVILRAREAEMQFLRQEAHSLKEELKIARMDKIGAQNKLKALYTKSQDVPCRDTSNLRDSFKFSTWSPSKGASGQTAEETGAKTSSLKKSSFLRQFRGVRSKSLKDGLSSQETLKKD